MRRQIVSHDSLYFVLNQKNLDAVSAAIAGDIRSEREKQNMSMNRLAERAGLSQQMVSYVERGMRNPTIETLLRIASALEIDLVDVLQRAQRAATKAKTQ